MVSTPLKNISQIGNLPQIGVKIENISNHHLVNYLPTNVLNIEITTIQKDRQLYSSHRWYGKLIISWLWEFLGRTFEAEIGSFTSIYATFSIPQDLFEGSTHQSSRWYDWESSLFCLYEYQHPPRGGVWTLRDCLVAPLGGSRYKFKYLEIPFLGCQMVPLCPVVKKKNPPLISRIRTPTCKVLVKMDSVGRLRIPFGFRPIFQAIFTEDFRYRKWRVHPHLYKLYGYGLCKGFHPLPVPSRLSGSGNPPF